MNWPEVVSYDGTNLMDQPKTMAAWKLDDGPIKTNLWTISDTGTAAGEFGSRSAQKLLASFLSARRLVVRLSGRMTQDAVFSIDGISEVAPEVAGACGIALQGVR